MTINFFKTQLKKQWQNQLIAGSLILFVGTMVANFGQYLFHLVMGRMLGPVDYGVLASLISLTYLFGIPIGALNWTTIKYIATLRGKRKWGEISLFYNWLNQKLVILGLAGFLFLLLLSPWLKAFLHLESIFPLWLVIGASITSIYLMINTAVLQGYLRFGLMSASAIIQATARLFFGPLLLIIGLKVLGATLAIFLCLLLGYLFTLYFVRKQLSQKPEGEIKAREVFDYLVPVFFWTLAFVSLYTTDIVLARHFLSPQEAGFYAALATLGKIIFFAASPIVMVMFPLVSERHANGKKYGHYLYLSLVMVFLVCLGITGLYCLFPQLMVNLLYGPQYLAAAPFLWLFALFLSFYTLAYLLTNFYLSIRKTKVVILPVVAAFLQIILIFFFHQDLRQTVSVSVIILALLTGALLLYNASRRPPEVSGG